MSNSMRSDALGAAIAVCLYSWFCLFLNMLLVCMLWRFGERFTYVSLIAAFTYISTSASIIQQIHYMASWRAVKQGKFDHDILPIGTAHPGFGVDSNPMDEALNLIQFYCYNVESILVLFWAATLFRGCWGLKLNWMGEWYYKSGTISKVVAVLLPVLTLTLMNIEAIILIRPLYFTIINALMAFSLFTGSALLVLILYKYVKTRRLLVRPAARSKWWYSPSASKSTSVSQQYHSSTEGGSESEAGVPSRKSRRAIYDRSLIIRFTIAFVCLAAFEIAVIVFQTIAALNESPEKTKEEGPDFSYSGTIYDIVEFIPGVTASFAVFLIIGTTKSWAQYKDLMLIPFRWCGVCAEKRRRSRKPKYSMRMNDEAPLAFEEQATTSPIPRDAQADADSLDFEEEGRNMEMMDVNPSNPLRRHPTMSANFSKPLPTMPSANTISQEHLTMPAPVVLTSTTIEVETSSEANFDYARDIGDRVFKGGPTTTTTVTAINPHYTSDDTRSVAFNPRVQIQGQGQGSLRSPSFFWDSASEKGAEVHERPIN